MEDSDELPSDGEGYVHSAEREGLRGQSRTDEDSEVEDLPSKSEDEDGSEQEQPRAFKIPPSKPLASDLEPTEDLSLTLRKTRDDDRKKGKSVSRQIVRYAIRVSLTLG